MVPSSFVKHCRNYLPGRFIVKKMLGCLRSFRNCRRGNIGIIAALSVLPFFGAAGVAIDYGRAANARQALQLAADAAVLSASSPEVAAANRSNVAQSVFTANVQSNADVRSAVAVVSTANNTVVVSSVVPVPTTMTRIIGFTEIPVHANASAAVGKNYGNAAPACVLALSTTADGAFYVNGTTSFEAINCGVYSNSAASESMRSVGDPNVSATNFCTVGGADINGNFLPLPVTGCSAVPDPLAGLTPPSSEDCAGAAKGTTFKKGSHTLSPGTYCGGLELMAQAVVTFEPGVYVIKNGPLIFRSGSQSTGTDVSFFVTGTDVLVKVNGGADVDARAPSSGPLAGILFAQDAASNPGATSIIQGGGSVKLVGTIYLPTQTLQIGGNGDLGQNTSAWAIIADQVHLKGNGAVRIEAAFTSEALPDVTALPTNTATRLLN